MFELPPNLPPVQEVEPKVLERCVNYSSRYFGIHPNIIKSIIIVEGGKNGSMSRNSNGTYDMGIMQINTIHLPDIIRKYPGLTWSDVSYKPCVNIGIGASILNDRLKELKPNQDYWIGVGNYHSKTPKYRTLYLSKIYSAYRKLIKNKGKIK